MSVVISGFVAENKQVLDDGDLEDLLLAAPLSAGLLETQVGLAKTLAALVGVDDAGRTVASCMAFHSPCPVL